MKERLAGTPTSACTHTAAIKPDPRRTFAIEEFVAGDEYSCDFVLDRGRAEIIRTAHKLPATDMAVGTILAYEVPAALPARSTRELPYTDCRPPRERWPHARHLHARLHRA